jgi:Flp pilus assembly protein TadG
MESGLVMQRSRDDRGSITAFVLMLTMTFVACAGLAVDGGRLVAAKIQLADQAENAARAGTQEITALRTGDPKVDVDKAIMTAEDFMARHQIHGQASATPSEVTVTTSRVVSMSLLKLFGVGSRMISAQRSARPVTSP